MGKNGGGGGGGESIEEIDVPKRQVHVVPFEVHDVGSLLKWSFSTKKKNIAFGVSFRPSTKYQARLLSSSQISLVFQSLGPGDLSIYPPPLRKRSLVERYKDNVISARLLPRDSATVLVSSPPLKTSVRLIRKPVFSLCCSPSPVVGR
jgi:hypothetical protein